MRSYPRAGIVLVLVLAVALAAVFIAGCAEDGGGASSTTPADDAATSLEAASTPEGTAPEARTDTATVGIQAAPTTTGDTDAAAGTREASQGFGTVSGTVTYREGVSLPAEATVRVSLTEVPAVDPEAVVVEQVIVTRGRQVPIPFELRYDLASIDQAGGYGIVVTISTPAGLAFVTPQPVPVITRGAPSTVEVVLRRSGD